MSWWPLILVTAQGCVTCGLGWIALSSARPLPWWLMAFGAFLMMLRRATGGMELGEFSELADTICLPCAVTLLQLAAVTLLVVDLERSRRSAPT